MRESRECRKMYIDEPIPMSTATAPHLLVGEIEFATAGQRKTKYWQIKIVSLRSYSWKRNHDQILTSIVFVFETFTGIRNWRYTVLSSVIDNSSHEHSKLSMLMFLRKNMKVFDHFSHFTINSALSLFYVGFGFD